MTLCVQQTLRSGNCFLTISGIQGLQLRVYKQGVQPERAMGRPGVGGSDRGGGCGRHLFCTANLRPAGESWRLPNNCPGQAPSCPTTSRTSSPTSWTSHESSLRLWKGSTQRNPPTPNQEVDRHLDHEEATSPPCIGMGLQRQYTSSLLQRPQPSRRTVGVRRERWTV